LGRRSFDKRGRGLAKALEQQAASGAAPASRQTQERQSDRIAELERENGRATAERDGARTETEALKAPAATGNSGEPDQPVPATDAPVPPSARPRALAPWLLVALAIGAVVALVVR
jgi:hypothetical protein